MFGKSLSMSQKNFFGFDAADQSSKKIVPSFSDKSRKIEIEKSKKTSENKSW